MLDPDSSSAQDDIPMRMSTMLRWCRRHILVATGIAIVAFYFIGFRFYYCAKEGCTHPADWWFHLPAEAQAAWVGSLGTLVAVWWGFVLFWQDRQQKREITRKAARPAVYPLISQIEAIEHRFNNLGLLHSEAAKILAVSAKSGELKQDLLAVNASLALLQDDDVAALAELNAALEELNDAASRCGTDLDYGGTTGEDLLFLAQKVQDCIREALSLLRSRYTIRRVRILEASDSPDDE